MTGVTSQDVERYYRNISELDADYEVLYPTGRDDDQSRYGDASNSESLFDSDVDDDTSDDGGSNNGDGEKVIIIIMIIIMIIMIMIMIMRINYGQLFHLFDNFRNTFR